jgi:hypothetical protein
MPLITAPSLSTIPELDVVETFPEDSKRHIDPELNLALEHLHWRIEFHYRSKPINRENKRKHPAQNAALIVETILESQNLSF